MGVGLISVLDYREYFQPSLLRVPRNPVQKIIAPALVAVMPQRIFETRTLLTIMFFRRPLRVCGMGVNLRFHDMGVRSDP